MTNQLYKIFGLTGIFDSHAHINSSHFDLNREEVIKKAREQKLASVFDVSTNLESALLSLDISSRSNGFIKTWIGIDPEVFVPGSDLFVVQEIKKDWFDLNFQKLDEVITSYKEYIVGIGETGMDYYWLENVYKTQDIDKELVKKSKKLQEKLFRMHIQLAKKHDLPLTIHSRGAEEACLKLVKAQNVTGIFHSYTGDYSTAKSILDSGFGLGVNGIVTFKNAIELRSVYKKILGKIKKEVEPQYFYKKGIFFETDAPFLAPEGKRGELNTPANVVDVYNAFVETLK